MIEHEYISREVRVKVLNITHHFGAISYTELGNISDLSCIDNGHDTTL